MTDIREVLDEIEKGCEGVTPGPWTPGIAGDYPADTPHGEDFTPIHSDTWGAFVSVVTNTDGSFGRVGTIAQGQANLAHIARLDPQTMLAIIALARKGLAAEAGDARDEVLDFAAWLATRPTVISVGASETVYGMFAAAEEWRNAHPLPASPTQEPA